MAQMVGMDVEQVKALSKQMTDGASTIQDLIGRLTSGLNSTTWVGADRTKFDGDWENYKGMLTKVAGSLTETANHLTQQATSQEQASGN
ncbi:MAG: hypothetical protein QG597_1277 [Actinomycetota bacterium]|jgi:WXG100 family type VII secretion target|nr:hypothetical protein [Actinomycetota bacterium]